MKTDSGKITGYVWYNPDMGLYQKGSGHEFQTFLEQSGLKKEFSLILKLTNESDLLAYKIVKQLNVARAELQEKARYAV
ncbi:MAG: hypothetical protein WBA74_02440 [Cyclobacteriaceae bacterium]